MRELPTINIKGKKYVMVKDRVAAFREDYPNGSIMTEIKLDEDGKAVCKATIVNEDGRILATGHAYEWENSTNINKTSYIENCETSAIGRALGFCGYGIDDSIGSADEVANAMLQQAELCSDADKAKFTALCGKAGVKPQDVLRAVGWRGGNMTIKQYADGIKHMQAEGLIE